MSKTDHVLKGQSKDFIKSLRRNVKLMVEVYNNLCVDCKWLVVMRERRNLKTGYELYCVSCQSMIDKLNKKVK